MGLDLSLGFPVRSLRDAHVAQALAATGLDPASLRLEIVEAALIEDIRATAGTLRALRELGVRLAIDDFGAGASSLASFRELSADVVTLDRSFIGPLGGGSEDEAIVAAIAALAHRLGMRVTAEGIETEERLAAVRRAGCDSGQGFLLGRPVPADRVLDLLRRGQAITAPLIAAENGVMGESVQASI
jgi:EAL domain-containing protein (putative c-di-GMP-specific phosphodiesterase class I)